MRLLSQSEECERDRAHHNAMARKHRKAAWDKTAGRCWWCGVHMEWGADFTVDHLVPTSNGGSDELDNLVPACKGCNSRRRNRDLRWFRRTMSGIPFFNERQLEYLHNIGVTISDGDYVFYFEKCGWEIEVE